MASTDNDDLRLVSVDILLVLLAADEPRFTADIVAVVDALGARGARFLFVADQLLDAHVEEVGLRAKVSGSSTMRKSAAHLPLFGAGVLLETDASPAPGDGRLKVVESHDPDESRHGFKSSSGSLLHLDILDLPLPKLFVLQEPLFDLGLVLLAVVIPLEREEVLPVCIFMKEGEDIVDVLCVERLLEFGEPVGGDLARLFGRGELDFGGVATHRCGAGALHDAVGLLEELWKLLVRASDDVGGGWSHGDLLCFNGLFECYEGDVVEGR